MSTLSEERVDPVYRKVYERLRVSIVDGRLPVGQRIPSARSLAAQLGVARGTIDLAYAVLVGEGYLIADGARGTFVSPSLPPRAQPATTAAGRRTAEAAPPPMKLAFFVGLPALDLFPRKAWSRLVARRSRALCQMDLCYPPCTGDPALKSALIAYLAVSRGIQCTVEQVIITGGYQAALGLVSRMIVARGDKVWVEDPGHIQTRRAFGAIGAIPTPVAVDTEGLDVEAGRRAAPDAKLCVVTPSNQYPLGCAMSLRRRLALLDWAASAGAWIIEDDYDSEFYYRGRLLPALKSLDHDDRVFYVGTFSKTLYPGLRLGYVIVPSAQTQRFHTACDLLDGGRAGLDQAVVADFIHEGYFARHLKKMRAAYKSRRTAVAMALSSQLGRCMTIDLQHGGMHIIGRLDQSVDDRALARAARASGYNVVSLSNLSSSADAPKGLLLGFTNVPERQAPEAVAEFRNALRLG